MSVLPATPTPHRRLAFIPHFDPQPAVGELAAVDALAVEIARESPELRLDDRFHGLALDHWQDGPTLHLDDFSEISRPNWADTIDYMQDRARLRAGDGDYCVTAQPPIAGYPEYTRDRLGLGQVQWLTPAKVTGSLAVATWQDRGLRRRLVSAMRKGALAAIHPHMGAQMVWELAAQLRQSAGRPLAVIGPPPGVCRWANDKIAFARTVARLLGPSFIPRTDEACNLATLARRVLDLSERMEFVAVKVPDSAGGGGNYLLDSERLRGRSLAQVRRLLPSVLRGVTWQENTSLLVGCWETNVLAAPSAQLWLPPAGTGEPLVEGIFLQRVDGDAGVFSGTGPAELPDKLSADIARWSWLLGRLFQKLGYVGRCSFDTVLIGQSLNHCRVKFIECNARWGGTSLPMSLMNRLFGDWARQPFAVRDFTVDGLNRVPFIDVLAALDDRLYDCRTGKGALILMTPAKLAHTGVLTVLARASTQAAAEHRAASHVLPRLRNIVDG